MGPAGKRKIAKIKSNRNLAAGGDKQAHDRRMTVSLQTATPMPLEDTTA
jgi:hypothetical protein